MTEEHGKATGRMVLMGYRLDEEIGGEARRRLQELEAKAESRPGQGLTSEEMQEIREIHETHSSAVYYEAPDFTTLGVTRPYVFLENFGFVEERAEEAYQNTFFMEAISLRMLQLDFILRAYIVHKTNRAIKPFAKEDKRSFGQALNEAEKLGLHLELVASLAAFNSKRVNGIHHFITGRASYQEIGDAYRDADGLFEQIITAMDLPVVTEDF